MSYATQDRFGNVKIEGWTGGSCQIFAGTISCDFGTEWKSRNDGVIWRFVDPTREMMRPEIETRASDMATSQFRDPEPTRAAMYANNNIPPNVLSSKVDDFFAKRAGCRRLYKEGLAASCQALAGTAPTP